MRLRFKCPECHHWIVPPIDTSNGEAKGTATCPKGHSLSYTLSDSIRERNVWDLCPHCQCSEAYIQKAVPKNVFLATLVVYLGMVLYFFSVNWYLAMGLLVGIAILDFFLFRLLPSAVVCYKCSTQARRFSPNPMHRPHDHHIGERYRRKRIA